MESHPHLPLYVTGNRKGILCTWKFGQTEDKSLNQFMPEIDPRQADIKKACIKVRKLASSKVTKKAKKKVLLRVMPKAMKLASSKVSLLGKSTFNNKLLSLWGSRTSLLNLWS